MREYLVVDESHRAYGYLQVEDTTFEGPCYFAVDRAKFTLPREVVQSKRVGSEVVTARVLVAYSTERMALLLLDREVFETIAERYAR